MELPGRYPFTRGIQPEMYRTRLWTMRQYAGFGTARETNQRFRFLLRGGQTGLSAAFDLPTQLGYDADDPVARGEVGKVGVAISSLDDMEILLGRIPLDEISLSMTINAPAAILLAMVLAIARKRRVPWKKLRGTIQNDILKEYLARGTYIFPPAPSLKLVADTVAFTAREAPRWHPISVSGYHIREAGATAAQELALTLAHGETYVREVLKTGLRVDQFAPKFSFFFAVHNNFFEEIAKFRAARRLWAKLMREKFRARSDESCKLRFHAQTGGVTLTAQQPENNVVRTTYQALAAVLGGAQSLHTNAMDEALALPTESAALLALRTQQIIAHESDVPSVADPLGGSEWLEELTQRLEKEALAIRRQIEKSGGVLKALESGFTKRMIEASAYVLQKKFENGERRIVGVNCFTEEGEKLSIPLHRHNLKLEKAQIRTLRAFKARRRQSLVLAMLEKLRRAAENGDSLPPLFVEAVENKCTIGEICNVLRLVYGEYKA